jgi:hypothetical protein
LGNGFDTSLTRIAVFSVTFIPGITASTTQCRTAGRRHGNGFRGLSERDGGSASSDARQPR